MPLGPLFGIASQFLAQPVKRRQARLARAQSQAAVRAAQMNKEQFEEDRPFKEAELRQKYFGSGLGSSSARTEGEGRFQNAMRRTAQRLDDNMRIAIANKKASHAARKYGNQMDFFNLLGNIGQGASAMFGG